MKDKITHKSKGVAFVLFLERESAHQCIRAINNTQVRRKFQIVQISNGLF